ncbi:MAG: PilZ domain-containing protein [Treponemataceae bacterium]
MGVATSQQLVKYYERYKAIDVTFTKEVIKSSGLVTAQVYLKCLGETWPCVIYSSSFANAKIIINAKSGVFGKIQQANNLISIRYCFKESDKVDPFMFFVAGKMTGSAPYGGSADVSLLTMSFTQRPPDDLIEIMGRLLDANINSAKRREERILITPDVMRRMHLVSKETAIFIQGVPRRCILRDLSFSGVKIIMAGVAKFLLERDAAVRLDFEDPRESYLIKGKIVRSEDIEGRKDLVALALCFGDQAVPMNYKLRVNDFLTQGRADNRAEQGANDGAK